MIADRIAYVAGVMIGLALIAVATWREIKDWRGSWK